jgi:hypothetical protein
MRALVILAMLASASAQRDFLPRADFAFGAGLAWAASRDQVAGYRVYSGPASGQYTAVVDVGNVTRWRVRTQGKTWFAVKAYDAEGTESVFSNEVSIP